MAGTRVGRIATPYDHFANSKGLSDWLARHDRYSSWDAEKIVAMNFPVFAVGFSPLDSKGRLDGVSYGQPIRVGDCVVRPGDWVFGDVDGVVVVPAQLAEAAFAKALEKVSGENRVRAELATRKLRLPLLGSSDDTANREYIKRFVLKGDIELMNLSDASSWKRLTRQFEHLNDPGVLPTASPDGTKFH